jgi:hypothetical protein
MPMHSIGEHISHFFRIIHAFSLAHRGPRDSELEAKYGQFSHLPNVNQSNLFSYGNLFLFCHMHHQGTLVVKILRDHGLLDNT